MVARNATKRGRKLKNSEKIVFEDFGLRSLFRKKVIMDRDETHWGCFKKFGSGHSLWVYAQTIRSNATKRGGEL